MSVVEYDDLKLEMTKIIKAEIEIKGMRQQEMIYFELSTGQLFISLSEFEGFMFRDKYNNFYDTIRKKIIFHDKLASFEGDSDKEAFSLFEN